MFERMTGTEAGGGRAVMPCLVGALDEYISRARYTTEYWSE
jgi:hypothetical protein